MPHATGFFYLLFVLNKLYIFSWLHMSFFFNRMEHKNLFMEHKSLYQFQVHPADSPLDPSLAIVCMVVLSVLLTLEASDSLFVP
jgi:hypothetical protein